MTQVPVTVHEQALEELLPVKREIQQSLCALLPESGDLGLLELNSFLPRIGSETEAVIDRALGDILDWLERYESIVRHPEEWQGRDAHLMLIIEAEEELDALHRLLEKSGYALNDGMLLPGSQHGKKGLGLMSLLAAFGLDMWLGDDD